MDDSLIRPKTYEEGIRDGFQEGIKEANMVLESLLKTSVKPILCELPESEAVKILLKQIEDMKCYMNCDYSTHVNGCPVLKKKKITDCKGCNEWRLREWK